MFKSLSAFTLLVGIFLSDSLVAQQTSVSPYSRFGLGEFKSPQFARGLTMGGANLALRDALHINNTNPASYTSLQLTTFEAGFELSGIRQEQQNPDVSIENSVAGIRYFAIGVPIKTWWGTSIGVQPYTTKGYNIQNERLGPDSLKINDVFDGTGGLNRLYWGNAFRVAQGLSLGLNANFIFGSLDENATLNFDQGLFNSRIEDQVTIRGFRFDYGLQYHYTFKNNLEVSTGITFANRSGLNATVDRYSYVFNLQGPLDSLESQSTTDREILLPSEFGFGLTIAKRSFFKTNWSLSADFETYKGSNFENFNGSMPFQDGWRAEVGGTIIPILAFKKLEKSRNYLGQIEYRLGGFYENTPLSLNGTQIQDYGIAFGFGLPVKQRNVNPGEVKLSTVNTGLVLGRRGTLENSLIQESYLQFYLGIAINDKWFIKYRYR